MVLLRVLGPIEVRAAAEQSWVRPPPQQRLLLALLVTHLGHPGRADQLAQAVWGEAPPSNARRLLQAAISRLRHLLGPADVARSRLRTVPEGWILDLAPAEVDATGFHELARGGRALADRGDLGAARRQLEEAVALWRGRPFGELADHPAVVAETVRLTEERASVDEGLLQVRLRAGEHVAVTAELEASSRAIPCGSGRGGC